MKHARVPVETIVFCTLALASLVGGCTHNDAGSATSAEAGVAQVSVAPDGMPEVIISAPRPVAKPIVLSEGDSGSTGK
jgi:hypothetical protein